MIKLVRMLQIFSSSKSFLILTLLLVAVIYGLFIPLTGHEQDIKDIRNWSLIAINSGISQIYNGDSIETFSFYPPLNILAIKLLGNLYQLFNPMTSFSGLESLYIVKIPTLIFHLINTALIYFLYKGSGRRLVTLSYGLNPAILVNTAIFGEPDALHTLLLVLSTAVLFTKFKNLSGFVLVMAFFTKPQAWIFIPFILTLIILRSDKRQLIFQGILSASCFFLIALPFLYYGTFPNLVKSITGSLGVLPNITNHAFNLWSLFAKGAVDYIPDSIRLLGLISPWGAGMLIFGLVYLIIIIKLTKTYNSFNQVMLLSAMLAMSYFMLLTRVHKNHIYFTLPFLALSFNFRFSRIAFYIFTLTFLLNWVIFNDFSAYYLNEYSIAGIGYLAGLVNLMTFIYFVYKTINNTTNSIFSELKMFKKMILFLSLILLLSSAILMQMRIKIIELLEISIMQIWSNFEKTSSFGYYINLIDSMYHQISIIFLILGFLGIILFLILNNKK